MGGPLWSSTSLLICRLRIMVLEEPHITCTPNFQTNTVCAPRSFIHIEQITKHVSIRRLRWPLMRKKASNKRGSVYFEVGIRVLCGFFFLNYYYYHFCQLLHSTKIYTMKLRVLHQLFYYEVSTRIKFNFRPPLV